MRQPYLAVLILSAVLSVGTVIKLVRNIAADAAAGILAIVVLTFSKAFVEYATSGFHTPLTHFLVVWFWAMYFKRSSRSRPVGMLSLIAGCAC